MTKAVLLSVPICRPTSNRTMFGPQLLAQERSGVGCDASPRGALLGLLELA
jgi:hypothetical protein